jgi:hypothetical protein
LLEGESSDAVATLSNGAGATYCCTVRLRQGRSPLRFLGEETVRPRRLTHLLSLLLVPILALAVVACADDDVEEDPRGSLRDAMMSLGDWEGAEITLGVQLDETAQASAREEGELSDDELSLLMDSNLVIRAAQTGEGEDASGEAEIVLTVADEQVMSIRSLPEYRLYALLDLEAMEQVAESLDEGDAFREGVGEMESMAGMIGMQDVFDAARESEWVRITGVEQMAGMFEGMAGEQTQEQPDEEELEEAGRNIGERLVRFLDEDGVNVTHLGSEDAGERLNVTMRGAALRELIADVLAELEAVEGVPDPTGGGMGMADLRQELEESIPDDTEVAFDAWIDGGELSQIAVDVFEVARAAGEEDVPDGEFLVALALSEFTGGVEEPETDVTFDVFGVVGNFMGGMMGGLGDDPFADDGFEDLPDDAFEDEEAFEDELSEDDFSGEEFCLTQEEIDQMLSQMPEDQREIAEEELEAGAIPIC